MTGSVAQQRLISADLLEWETTTDGLSTELATASSRLALFNATELGVWDASPGTDVDTEVNELFLVLSGTGVVTFDDGSSIELRPGVLVRLVEGDRTRWTVTQQLRKLYLT